tara:strand:- start:1267 stop:3447 length:2181 start_codon:yes stop_codon:yes gene_type:complete
MVMVCRQVALGYEDDYGNPEYETVCEDDGTDNPDNAYDPYDYFTPTPGNVTYDSYSSPLGDTSEWFKTDVTTKTATADTDASGNITYKYDDGSTLTVDKSGNPISNTESADAKGNSVAANRAIAWAAKNLGSNASKVLQSVLNNGASIITALAAAKAIGGDKEGGYNVPVPKLDVVREQVAYKDVNRRPGAAGRQYFTDPKFATQGNATGLTAAQTLAGQQAAGILAAAPAYTVPVNKYDTTMKTPWNTPVAATTSGTGNTATNTAANTTAATAATGVASLPVIPTQQQLMDPNYKIGMASGGIANARYLQGGSDGMADKIPANIDGEQPAALSHGEFVIPADVVSHLGNGNSEAGADKLYQMMARIRKARTGNEKQGKKINPDKFMPGGLAAAYAAGGSVKHYDGNTSSLVSNTATSAGGVPLDTSKTSTLSPWAGDYVTNFLGQGAALANAPQQIYGGPLTAGASDLQQQGFAGISDVAAGGYTPGTFTNQFKSPGAYTPTTSSFDTAAASQYMNPYLTSALQPQIDEARRQSQITQQQNAAKMTQAGAFGGSRGAIMDAETQRSLGANLANITGTGYNTAYDKATQQFNADQARKMAEAQFGAGQGMTSAQNLAQYGQSAQAANEASRQYSSEFGLKSLSDLMSAGAAQRAIEGEGIAADKAQFEQQQAYPFNMVEFQRKLVEGLPIGASTTAVNQDAISKVQSDVAGLASLYKTLANLGVKK